MDIPTFEIKFTVPQIQSTVRGMVLAEIDKMQSSIEDEIKKALLARTDALEDQILQQVQSTFEEALLSRVRYRISEVLSEQEIYEKIDEKVRAAILAALS